MLGKHVVYLVSETTVTCHIPERKGNNLCILPAFKCSLEMWHLTKEIKPKLCSVEMGRRYGEMGSKAH